MDFERALKKRPYMFSGQDFSNPPTEQMNINVPTSLDQQENNLQRPGEGTSFEDEKDKSSYDDHQDCNNAQNLLAVYSPPDAAFDGIESRHSQNQAYHIGPSVVAYTARCSICFKWRIIPSKEKFEEIGEHISEHPFDCAAAREWRPEISCSDDPDITQDGSWLWAFVRPNIPRAPPGWERVLKIRGSGARFADVYYFTPSGKRLRSKVEVGRYLLEHPAEAEGVALSQFSFLIPKPCRELSKETGTY